MQPKCSIPTCEHQANAGILHMSYIWMRARNQSARWYNAAFLHMNYIWASEDMNLHLPCTYEYIWNTEFACKSVARSVHFYIWTTYEHGKQEPQNQQPTSTHSGAGEKETLNMNVVGKNGGRPFVICSNIDHLRTPRENIPDKYSHAYCPKIPDNIPDNNFWLIFPINIPD